jgi:hypothetical protein
LPLFRSPKTETEVDPAELELKPSEMRGTEAMYGYVVALELIVVAILELTVTHGKGAPVHPDTALAAGGLGASVVLLGIIAARKNRTLIALATILAALVVDLPAVPDRLALTKLFAVFIPLAYGIILIRRRTKSATARQRAGLDPEGPRRTSNRTGKAPVAKPVTTGRYTPPKAKREEATKKRRSRSR